MTTLSEYLSSYKFEAFRLETLPEYKSNSEISALKLFLTTGRLIEITGIGDFYNNVTTKSLLGAKHYRTRIIDIVTPYLRFETNAGYKNYEKNNIKLNFIPKSEYLQILKNNGFENELFDFWIFDNRHLIKMLYNNEGEFKGIEALTIDIDPFLKLKNELLATGFDLNYALTAFPELN